MDFDRLSALARVLMDRHELHDWDFVFNDHSERFGLCNHTTRTITLSYLLSAFNSEETCQQVLLHEIAHALVGQGHGHSIVWRMKAIEIGCLGTRSILASVVSSFREDIVGAIRESFVARKTTPESVSMLELTHLCANDSF